LYDLVANIATARQHKLRVYEVVDDPAAKALHGRQGEGRDP
jgi:hypothetical protein